MDGFTFFLGFHAILLSISLIIIIVLIIRKSKKRKKENFEKRNN